ncbi:MAG: aryl-sulfate sulfotransferase [Myxococcota bacterium]
MYTRKTLSMVLLTAAVALAGCSGDDGDNHSNDAGTDTDAPETLELQTVQNPNNALSYYVSWDTQAASSTTLQVDCGDDWSQTYESDGLVTEHEVFVMGLWDGASCDLTATSVAENGVESTGESSLDVGPLPEFLPELEVTTNVEGEVQPGWTLFNLTNDVDDVPLIIAVVDPEGRYRWYHQMATSSPGSDTDVRLVEEGILVGGTRGRVWPTLLDWEGQVVWQREIRMHHHIMPYQENQFIYLTFRSDCPMDIGAGVIHVWDREQDEVVQEHTFCEWFVPDAYVPDWSHLNTIEVFPEDPNSLLVSSRNQNSLIKLDLAAEDSVWRLGVNGDFDMAEEDLFWQQHAPEFQENGNLVIFDNGFRGEREYSRLIEVAYDDSAMTAEVVWEYAPDPQIFTPIWGDSDRQPNGNTIGTFGRRQADKRSFIHEVDAETNLVWALQTPNGWGWYRSERIDVPVPGYVIE